MCDIWRRKVETSKSDTRREEGSSNPAEQAPKGKAWHAPVLATIYLADVTLGQAGVSSDGITVR